MSELSKNKRLKKLYDFGDRITPQKWAKAIDILVPEESGGGGGEIIKTTYEEAKALYESGNMKKGVIYEFNCTQDRALPGKFEFFLATIPIKVTLNDDNTLKALGEQSDYYGKSHHFIADYTFDKMYVSYTDEMGEGVLITRKPITVISFASADDEDFRAELYNKLIEANVNFIDHYDGDSIYTITALDSIVWIEEHEIWDEEDNIYYETHYNFYTKDKILDVSYDGPGSGNINIMDDSYYVPGDGLLSNLIYFSNGRSSIRKKHSYLFDGELGEPGMENFIRINCDIENDLDEYIIATEDIDVRTKGLIKHSILDTSSMSPSQYFSSLHLENSELIIGYQDSVSIKMIDSYAYFMGDLQKDVYLVNTTLRFTNPEDTTYAGSFVLGDLYYGANIDFENAPSDAERIVDLPSVRKYLMETISVEEE